MDVTIREATKDDAEEIASLMKLVHDSMANKALYVCDDLSYVKEQLSGNGFAFVCESDSGEIVGSFVCRFPHNSLDNLGLDVGLPSSVLHKVVHMESMVVHPDFRGMRLGKQMLEKCEEHAVSLGYNYMLCTVSPRNGPSLGVIESRKFNKACTKEKYGGLLRSIYLKIATARG